MRVLSHLREYSKVLLRNYCLHASQILEGVLFGANTCCACTYTRANTGKNSGELFMYWFRARGYFSEFLMSDVMYFALTMVCELIFWQSSSGRCMPGCLPSAWNTKITLHQLLEINS